MTRALRARGRGKALGLNADARYLMDNISSLLTRMNHICMQQTRSGNGEKTSLVHGLRTVPSLLWPPSLILMPDAVRRERHGWPAQ